MPLNALRLWCRDGLALRVHGAEVLVHVQVGKGTRLCLGRFSLTAHRRRRLTSLSDLLWRATLQLFLQQHRVMEARRERPRPQPQEEAPAPAAAAVAAPVASSASLSFEERLRLGSDV